MPDPSDPPRLELELDESPDPPEPSESSDEPIDDALLSGAPQAFVHCASTS